MAALLADRLPGFWSPENAKHDLSLEDLKNSYRNTALPTCIQLRWNARHADIVDFLVTHYQPGSDNTPYYDWMFKRACMKATLHHAAKNTIVGCVLGVRVPLLFPFKKGALNHQNVLLGTLLCVDKRLQKTGLVRQLLGAVIRESAAQGFLVRLSCTDKRLNLRPFHTVPRFVVYHAPYANPTPLGPTWEFGQAMDFLHQHLPPGGLYWPALVPVGCEQVYTWTSGSKVVGVLVLGPMNNASKQVVGIALETPRANVLAQFLQVATIYNPDGSRRLAPQVITLDACYEPNVCPTAMLTPAVNTPSYHVYLHNVNTDALVPFGVPYW